ncbi:MAG: hypothetical protein ACI8TQ_001197 [Planctomycetota bacterium]
MWDGRFDVLAGCVVLYRAVPGTKPSHSEQYDAKLGLDVSVGLAISIGCHGSNSPALSTHKCFTWSSAK